MEGYAKLASLMGSNPEVAILRRFSALNAQNLLYLQAELVDLEEDLRAIAAEDNTSEDPDRVIYSRDWYTLSRSKNHTADNKDAGRQWQIILSIREKLREYSSLAHCHTQSFRLLIISKTKPFTTRQPSPLCHLSTTTISPSYKSG